MEHMSSDQIKSTIRNLHERLEEAGPIDAETRALLTELDQDLHRLLTAKAEFEDKEAGLQERLESIAADFDSRHPQLAAMLREIGVALARVGI
jgi:chromosome segregation ATPase